MCIPSFNILALKVPEKTLLTCNIGKDRQMDKNRQIKAMTLSLNPTIQSLILHMYTIFEDSQSGENCDTNLTIKDRKITNKGKNKSKEFDFQSHNNTTKSFKILASKGPEKTLTRNFNVNL